MNSPEPNAVDRARAYYNDRSADGFYFRIWGGEDIHIGIYEDQDSVVEASRRTVATMASLLAREAPRGRVLDVGSGYGGPARFLAGTHGLRVDCLNLSDVQNLRTLRMNADQGLSGAIRVITGDFEAMPLAPDSYRLIWSQDALVHSAHRRRVLEEMDRVLAPGGQVLMTDIMESPSCPRESLGPILARIELESLGSFDFYRRTARELGWREVEILDLSPHLATHYRRVLEELEHRYDELAKVSDPAYLDNMLHGLRLWVDAGRKGHLHWGILHFRKPRARASPSPDHG